MWAQRKQTMNNTKQFFFTVFVAVVILAALSITANADFDEEERAAAEYCYNVQNGVWPDFNGTYKKECKKPLDER